MTAPPIHSPSPVTDLNQPIGFVLRTEIRWTESREAKGIVWVASDPLHNHHFRCSQFDYQVLQWLGPESTLESLVERFENSFRPRTISPQQLFAFLMACHDAGIVRRRLPQSTQALLADTRNGTANRSSKRNGSFALRCSRRVLKLMQSQISLGNPDRLLKDLLPVTGFLFSLPVFAMMLVCWSIASTLILFRWDTFWTELPTWNSLRSPAMLLGYGGLFFATRLVHELGHAIACKRFGVHCKDVGLLWSFGMLCPYVDITDGWRTGNRSHRLVIALAGMYWEGILAGIATFVWFFTVNGWLHDQAFRTILVCSVTTLLFNANPFMKYDGYFALSDALGIPHLREKAWQAMDGLWGGAAEIASSYPLFARLGLSLYFVLSLCNRLVLSVGLATFLYSVACYWQVAGIGVALFLLYACCVLILAVGSWTQSDTARGRPQDDSGRSAPLLRRTVMLGWVSVLCLVAWAIQIPLPNKVWVEGELTSGMVWPVYAAQSGAIVHIHSQLDGAVVQPGEQILLLENAMLKKRQMQLESERTQCRFRLDAAKRASFHDTQYLDSIPLLEKQLRWLETQVDETKGQIDQLTVASPAPGVFEFASHRQNDTQEQDHSIRLASFVHSEWKRRRPKWSVGEQCDRATLIGHVRSEGIHQIDCLLTEEQFTDVIVGTPVVYRLAQNPTRVYRGRVQSIAKELELSSSSNRAVATAIRDTVSQTPFRYRITIDTTEWFRDSQLSKQAEPIANSAEFQSLPFGNVELMLIRPDKSALQWMIESSLRHFRLR